MATCDHLLLHAYLAYCRLCTLTKCITPFIRLTKFGHLAIPSELLTLRLSCGSLEPCIPTLFLLLWKTPSSNFPFSLYFFLSSSSQPVHYQLSVFMCLSCACPSYPIQDALYMIHSPLSPLLAPLQAEETGGGPVMARQTFSK